MTRVTPLSPAAAVDAAPVGASTVTGPICEAAVIADSEPADNAPAEVSASTRTDAARDCDEIAARSGRRMDERSMAFQFENARSANAAPRASTKRAFFFLFFSFFQFKSVRMQFSNSSEAPAVCTW